MLSRCALCSLTHCTANIDEHDDYDEETTGYLHKEIDEAENSNHPEGRPGSFLNRLISHGNKTTEEQIKKEMEAEQAAKQQRTKT